MTTTETTPKTAGGETFARLSPRVIDPDPENRSAPVDAEFRKSVAEHGVLEPVLVVSHPDDDRRYMLVAGERRWRAASEVGADDIPAVINSGLSEQERVVRQITENLHRLDLTPAAEASQFMRLARLDMGVRDVARQVGRSQRYVRDRLRIAELPSKAQALIDDRSWTIEDALAAARLLDHPDKLSELVDEGRGNVSWTVDRILDDLEREAQVTALVETAHGEGKTMVPDEAGTVELDSIGISEPDHAAEECHGYVVRAPRFGPSALVAVCTNRRNHAKRGNSEIKAVPPAKPGGLSDSEAAQQKAKRDANTERVAAIGLAVNGKVTKAEAAALILPALLDATSAEDAKKAAKVLGLEGGKDTYWPTALREHAAQSDVALNRAALAVALIVGNRHIHSGWSDPHGLGFRTAEVLKRRGWKPSAHDRSRLKALKTN